MKLLILSSLLFFTGCAAFSPQTFADKKRDCHTHYLGNFGLKTDSAISICKEELERAE